MLLRTPLAKPLPPRRAQLGGRSARRGQPWTGAHAGVSPRSHAAGLPGGSCTAVDLRSPGLTSEG
eukprot:14019912-Alexandrium_andersonii.AAC.1